ncbi:phage tail protein [Lysinibacillus sp. FSL W8-0992]|uniref:phage tail protein n=1 Tax=Lysinibacillus sp. FSL W8-0992 TaxID=2954643 RepID=UPI0030F8CA6B
MAEPFLGEIRLFSFDKIPRGWLPCNGQLLSITTNTALYSLLGFTYGGDGKTTFAIPNLQGKVPIHAGNQIAYGLAGGEAEHTLTVNEMPAHTHQITADSSTTDKPSPKDNTWGAVNGKDIYAKNDNVAMHEAALSITGQSKPHTNMQPFLSVSFCIATMGIFPSRG